MDPISSILIKKALDGLSLRAAVIADNVANANSPGFLPRKVAFEQELQAAAKLGVTAIRDSQARIETPPNSVLNAAVRLDLEMADAARTAARYGALIDIYGRQAQIHRTAVRGGQ